MMTAPQPMHPERLAQIRAQTAQLCVDLPEAEPGVEWHTQPAVATSMVRDLLADRDYQAQQLDACAKKLSDWDPTGRKPAPYSVREAIREAGLDESLSSAEAIRCLARCIRAAERALEHRWTNEAVLRLLRGDE